MDVQNEARGSAARPSTSPVVVLPMDLEDGRSRETNTPNGIRSSPPAMNRPDTMDIDRDVPHGGNVLGEKSDSEAETIVLPGKDGHSPSKIRKSIKHEDKSEEEDTTSVSSPRIHGETGRDSISHLIEENTTATSLTSLGKRKRPKTSNIKDDSAHLGNSSGLSSVPTSPVATTRSSLSKPAVSDSDMSKSPSPRPHSRAREQAKSVDRVIPQKKYVSQSGDEDEGERRRFARQRSSGAEHKSNRDNRSSSKYRPEPHSGKRTRSTSPPTRGHRRSVSNQVATKSSQGLSHKKKRVPAPLQSTEYHSEDSSASEGSHHRSSRLRSLAAPVTGGSTMSPVKMAPHKKHVNSSGQTLLARACLSGKLDVAKQRYEERPQDLNEPDHALNTPLHVASINGYEDVVKFLLDKNCVVDAVNDQKDTPLHDAIENGHVEVVKLLFDAGADPNKPNRHGDEPMDLVNDKEESGAYDESEASDIRAAILEAKKNNRDTRRLSEDDHKERYSPSVPAYDSHLSATGRRVGTARSQKTSDHLLYQPLTATELQKAAKEGDASAAARVLEVHANLNDTKSLTLAAKGGHLDVLNILFAMGGFDPDPPLAEGVSLEQATPILAAIGRDAHLKVIELILGQDNFNPTRLIKGKTYYEIARDRAGPKWQEEEKLLRDAYEKYEKMHKKSPRKVRSPELRRDGRESSRDVRKGPKVENSQPSRSHKRSMSSPKTKDHESAKRKDSSSLNNLNKDGHAKRGPGRPRKEEISATTIALDPEAAPVGPPKQNTNNKHAELEVAVASENEGATKPRRKLVSGKDLRGERELEKQRRTSVTSNVSSASVKDKRALNESKPDKNDGRVSPNIPRLGKKSISSHNDHDLPDHKSSDKDRARSIKRDDSKDRITAIRGESPVKRHRKSETPPRSVLQEVTTGYSAAGGPLKRRKLESDGVMDSRADSTPTSSPDIRTSAKKSPLPSSEDGIEKALHSKPKGPQPVKKQLTLADDTTKNAIGDSSTHGRPTKSPVHRLGAPIDSETQKHKLASEEQSDRLEREKERALKRKEEAAVREAEAKRKADIAREAEAVAQREKEKEVARQKKIEEEQERERVEKANQARLAREQAAREEEEKKQAEEAAEKERQRIQEAEASAREQERQRALYLEQEKAKREEQEKRRVAMEEQRRVERAKAEQAKRMERLSKLPLLLRWFDVSENLNKREVASHFRWIDGYRFDTIRPEVTGQASGREQWMLNTSVAILLGEKDLGLSRYTAWEQVPLSLDVKKVIWRASNGMYTLREPHLATLPGLAEFRKMHPRDEASADEIVKKNRSLFFELDLFFVKVSEFMYIVPNFPHLRSVEMLVNYRELDTTFMMPPPPPKWKQDPDQDPNQSFAPQPKLYVNGQLIKQQETPLTKMTSEPPSSGKRVPRRELVEVKPDDPEYDELCRKQGLIHLIQSRKGTPSSQSSPVITQQNGHALHHGHVNGITPPSSVRTKSVNGGSPHEGYSHQRTNGVHPTSVSPIDAMPPSIS